VDGGSAVGLTLLEGVVARAGRTIAIRSASREETTVQLDLPAR